MRKRSSLFELERPSRADDQERTALKAGWIYMKKGGLGGWKETWLALEVVDGRNTLRW